MLTTQERARLTQMLTIVVKGKVWLLAQAKDSTWAIRLSTHPTKVLARLSEVPTYRESWDALYSVIVSPPRALSVDEIASLGHLLQQLLWTMENLRARSTVSAVRSSNPGLSPRAGVQSRAASAQHGHPVDGSSAAAMDLLR
ncbi:MAG: hypothetical protein WCG80_19220 [Spirochaetales bacterium]